MNPLCELSEESEGDASLGGASFSVGSTMEESLGRH